MTRRTPPHSSPFQGRDNRAPPAAPPKRGALGWGLLSCGGRPSAPDRRPQVPDGRTSVGRRQHIARAAHATPAVPPCIHAAWPLLERMAEKSRPTGTRPKAGRCPTEQSELSSGGSAWVARQPRTI